jgi:hypothetical protein
VRKTLLCLAVAVGLGATGAQAQAAWHTELGIQGGFVRLKPAGTNRNDAIDVLFAPGFDLGPAFPAPSMVYLITPLSDKVALEPSLSGSVLTQGASATLLQAGLRIDYAIASGLYAAGGGLLGRAGGGVGASGFELGLQLAGGYRFHLTGPVGARVEANVQTWKGKSGIRPINTYGLLFGIAARI